MQDSINLNSDKDYLISLLLGAHPVCKRTLVEGRHRSKDLTLSYYRVEVVFLKLGAARNK